MKTLTITESLVASLVHINNPGFGHTRVLHNEMNLSATEMEFLNDVLYDFSDLVVTTATTIPTTVQGAIYDCDAETTILTRSLCEYKGVKFIKEHYQYYDNDLTMLIFNETHVEYKL